ncbi:MAG TPA: M81 family metallopeptidase [Pyrinomonadaceae bacterium]|nr:M81 family metallopeptidase [Pyrinomonadaceae bacterium]
MKILVGGIYHESHSFSNVVTDIDSFRSVLLLEGRDCIDQLRGTTSEMAGFIQGAEKCGFEMVPTLWAWGLSTAPVEASALEYFIGIVQEAFENGGEIDGILFALHGAMVAEQALDGDGYVLSRFREFAGRDMPIVITLDLHANISDEMVEKADAIVGYDTYPHIDQVERGLEAAEILVRTIRGEIMPVMAISKPQMIVVPNVQLTDREPMKQLISLAHEIEKEEGVLSVTLAGGFAYSDVPEIGPSVVVVTDNDPSAAADHARRLADRFEELKEDFIPQLPDVAEAVTKAVAGSSYPIILADAGDNIGAGTPGDSTFILRELLEQKVDSAVVIIADPESVGRAVNAGIGQTVDLAIGGKTDGFHGNPVAIQARVKLISDGIFQNRGHMRDGIIEDMGRTAVVEADGIKIVLTEKKMPPWNLEQLRSVGITPEREKIIVLKSAVAFRAAYEPIAGDIIEVNSPGLSSIDLAQFDFKNIPRPIFPLDDMKADHAG